MIFLIYVYLEENGNDEEDINNKNVSSYNNSFIIYSIKNLQLEFY